MALIVPFAGQEPPQVGLSWWPDPDVVQILTHRKTCDTHPALQVVG